MANRKLRMYMASGLDPEEGAALVFHYTAKEAKKLAWDECSFITDVCDWEWTGLRVKWIRDAPWEEARSDEPHIVEDPATCPTCETWGFRRTEAGCEGCEGV